MTWTYKCGHTSEAVIMNNSYAGFAAFKRWKDTVGVDGTMEMCFKCYCDKNRK